MFCRLTHLHVSGTPLWRNAFGYAARDVLHKASSLEEASSLAESTVHPASVTTADAGNLSFLSRTSRLYPLFLSREPKEFFFFLVYFQAHPFKRKIQRSNSSRSLCDLTEATKCRCHCCHRSRSFMFERRVGASNSCQDEAPRNASQRR
jgi:hypothetical protein